MFSRLAGSTSGTHSPLGATKPTRRRTDRRARAVCPEQLESRQLLTGLSFDSVTAIGDGANSSRVMDMTLDAEGNQYVTGSFLGTVDFDPANEHVGNSDLLTSFGDKFSIYVAKYSVDGSLAWARRMGSDTTGVLKSEQGLGIVVDGMGNTYVTGSFNFTAEFGAYSVTSLGGQDAFLMKLDSQGAVAWATSWGTTGADTGQSLLLSNEGNIVVGSNSPGITNLHKFAPADGSQLWAKSYGGSSLGVGSKIAEDETGNLLLTNSFGSDPIDVDPGSGVYLIDHGIGSQGTYVLKLNSDAEFVWARTFETLASSPYGSAYPRDIAVDSVGAIIVSGNYRNLVDFNPAINGYYPLPNVPDGSFVTKLSTNGELMWARAMATEQKMLLTDTEDNIYSFGTTLTSLDASGNVRWESDLLGSGSDGVTIRAAAIFAGSSVIAAGYFTGTVDFDPGAGDQSLTAPISTGFLQRLTLGVCPDTSFDLEITEPMR